MPLKESPNTITVSKGMCETCQVLWQLDEQGKPLCPYSNRPDMNWTAFKGDNRGKCIYYLPFPKTAGAEQEMKKTAKSMIDAELNIEIFRKIMALSKEDRELFVNYWDHLYPDKYSKEMADDVNSITQKPPKEDLSKKKKKKKKKRSNNTTNKFPEPFKSGDSNDLVEPIKR